MVKNPDGFSDAEKPETLKKVLQICNKSYKARYTIGLNIQGDYLIKFGFELGDKINVEVSRNRILVEKIVGK